MLCSNCGEIIRPVVALDIDGTLGDYHGHFIRFASQYVGRELNSGYHGVPGFREWFALNNNIGTDEFRAIKLAYRQGGMKRSMPVFDGAQALVAEINAHDAELWVTTTRPYLSLDTIVPDTVEWLARNGMTDYFGMLFDEDKYEQLVYRVDPSRIVVVIDDLREMCDAADKAVGRRVAIMMGTSYNSIIQERRSPMYDIIAGIGAIIDQWRVEYAAA